MQAPPPGGMAVGEFAARLRRLAVPRAEAWTWPRRPSPPPPRDLSVTIPWGRVDGRLVMAPEAIRHRPFDFDRDAPALPPAPEPTRVAFRNFIKGGRPYYEKECPR